MSKSNQKKAVEAMSLADYYRKIPLHSAPRSEFVRVAAERCGVSEQTVRNWCLYGIKPQKYESVQVLSELTGIPAECLWL